MDWSPSFEVLYTVLEFSACGGLQPSDEHALSSSSQTFEGVRALGAKHGGQLFCDGLDGMERYAALATAPSWCSS